VRDSAVIRILGEQLVWYPPGSSEPPRPLSEEAELKQLQAIAAARRAPLVFAVPGAEVTLRRVEFTAAEKRHITRSLPFMLEDEFASDIEDLHFAAKPLEKLSLGVAVCAQEKMAHWEDQLAELPPIGLWVPEPLLLPWQPGELCVVLEANTIIARSDINSGFSSERDLAAFMLESLAQEQGFDTVIVYGADQESDLSLLPESLREQTQWRTGDLAAALMLAEEERHPLNLLQGEYGASLPVARWWQQWRIAAGLFAAAFALQLVSTYADYSALAAENLELRRQIEQTYREVNPRGNARDHVRALEQQLKTLQGGTRGASFVSVFDRIGRVVESEKGAQLASVNFNDKLGDVRLNLVVPDFKAVESIRTRLDAAGLQADMENSNSQGDAVRARLKVREK
jgi:type II secretion system protein L